MGMITDVGRNAILRICHPSKNFDVDRKKYLVYDNAIHPQKLIMMLIQSIVRLNQRIASTSISTSTFLGSVFTATAERAG